MPMTNLFRMVTSFLLCGVAFLAVLLVSSAGAAARDNAVFCAQGQINELHEMGVVSRNAGAQDGFAGANTTAGLDAYIAENGALQSGPWSVRYAHWWCRELAERHPELRHHVEEFKNSQVELNIDPNLAPDLQNKFRDHLQIALNYLAENYQYELRQTVRTYVSADPKWVYHATSAEPRMRGIPFSTWQDHCTARTNLNVAVFCLHRGAWSRPLYPEDELAQIVHEFAHNIQHELSRSPRGFVDNIEGGVKNFGLQWMIEGVPTAIQMRMIDERNPGFNMDGRMNGDLSHLRRMIAGKEFDLKDFETQRSDRRQEAGPVAQLAGDFLLSQLDNPHQVFDYWRKIGEGHGPHKAFEVAYGLKVDDFNARFNEYIGKRGNE